MAAGLEIEMDLGAAVDRLNKLGRNLNAQILLKVIGQRFLTWINLNFKNAGTEEKWPPLKPSTLAARRGGGGKPLMDTGRLMQSFTSRAEGSEAVNVGTQNQIAIFHQLGTRPYEIRPKKAGGRLSFMSASGPVFARKVNHPGLPKRPMIPSDQLANRIALDTTKKIVEKLVAQAK